MKPTTVVDILRDATEIFHELNQEYETNLKKW